MESPTTLASVTAMGFELYVANAEEFPQDLTLTESTLRLHLWGWIQLQGRCWIQCYRLLMACWG
jgi:hypothetical protein